MYRAVLLIISLFTIVQLQFAGIFPTLGDITKTSQVAQYGPASLTSSSASQSVIEKTLPSVVTIKATELSNNDSDRMRLPFPFRTLDHEPPIHQTENYIGSGFIAGKKGIVITNKHVISDNDHTYTVVTNDNKEFKITQIYQHPTTDLAILEVQGLNLEPILLGDSSDVGLGEPVYAIGTPLGEFTNSVTSGIISGLGRGITAGSPYEGNLDRLENLIQTDTAINPGNSGGPLINSSGEAIGINTASNEEGQNINFAIPSNVIKDFASNYKNGN